MSIVDLRGNNLNFKVGLVLWPNLHSNPLQMMKCYPHLKEDNLPI